MTQFNNQPHKSDLKSTGQLVSAGGLSGAVMTLIYVIIGIAFWSLVGFLLDKLFGTEFLVWGGALVGAVGGFYLVYYHMTHTQNRD